MNRTALFMLVVAAMLLAALFWLLKPGPEQDRQTAGVELPKDYSAEPRVVEIAISNGHRSAGPEVVRVTQGDEITLLFTSDRDAELHLHGYDRHLQLTAGQPAELTLTAGHSGRFEYELHGQDHGAHQALGVIEVLPK